MDNGSNGKLIFVNDGDTLIVIARTPLVLSDPRDEYPYVSQAYRVVADRFGPVLALVSLIEKPASISQDEVDQYVSRQVCEKNNESDLKRAVDNERTALTRFRLMLLESRLDGNVTSGS